MPFAVSGIHFVFVSEKCEVVTDSLAKKRSSPRSERRVQLTAAKTSSLSSLKHSQRTSPTDASSPSPGRPIRAKLVDSQTAEKSGDRKTEDTTGSSSGVEELMEKSNDWIHVTQRELNGIRELVEFLGSLEAGNWRVPSDIQSPDQLLANAKVISETYKTSCLVFIDFELESLLSHIMHLSV